MFTARSQATCHEGTCLAGVCVAGGMHSGRHAWQGCVYAMGCMHGRGACVTGGEHSMHAPLWTEWQTPVKILPCPKLCLRAVKISNLSIIFFVIWKNTVSVCTNLHVLFLHSSWYQGTKRLSTLNFIKAQQVWHGPKNTN